MNKSYGAVAAFVFLFVSVFGFNLANFFHVETRSCTVIDKDRTAGEDGKSNMRVYTKECGVLSVEDSFADGAWDSADRYSKLEVGKTYTMTTRGMRIPFFSMFPNIVEVK